MIELTLIDKLLFVLPTAAGIAGMFLYTRHQEKKEESE